MPTHPNNLPSDLRGASRLTTEAVTGITNIVESLHHTINSVSVKRLSKEPKRTTGITGAVYRNIRSVTELVGNKADAVLNRLSLMLGERESSQSREAILSALNGVLGDHLVARNNPLAIHMQLRHEGKPMNKHTLLEAIQKGNGKLNIMVHGSCMNDLQWTRNGHNHGAALSEDLGISPLYVYYNTGRHISENGRELSTLLESITKQSPQPVEFSIIAHSMGGLVARSACHYGKIKDRTWLKTLNNIIFLGTPHHGAPLEKGGSWVDMLLKISPYSTPFSKLGKIRSSGITDLRYGNILDEDWLERDRFEFSKDTRTSVPLPENIKCYAIAATTALKPNKLGDDLIGDGLVTVKSALGRHRNPEFNLLFPENHQWIGRGINHLGLLENPAVYEMIKTWLAT